MAELLTYFRVCSLILLFLLSVDGCVARAEVVDPKWTTAITPFKIADDLYYVGSQDLAAYLVTTPAGNILINANYTTSPPQIRHSVEQLGFRWKDTRILLISHAHVDHAGGAAEIRKETGAKLEVMEGDVDVMESGGKSDFAFGGPGKPLQFPPVHVDKTLHNGEEVTLGGVTLVAHRTPGHTRGCTSWTMTVHLPGDPASQRRGVVIVGSWSVLPSYRLLSLRDGLQASYPGIANDYAVTFSTLSALPCDVFLASHGQLFNMLEKLKQAKKRGAQVWVDPEGYRRAIERGEADYEAVYRRQSKPADAGNAQNLME